MDNTSDDVPPKEEAGDNNDVKIVIRKRGRPKRSRDFRPRKKRSKNPLTPDEEAAVNEAVSAYMANAAPGKDEEFVACHLVFADTSVASRIAVAEALSAPDADHWIEGMCLEKTKLEAYKSWRVMEKDEAKKFLDAGGKALPLVILLSRKRCGRYKARAVVLGNRWSNDGDAPTYSPVVSSAANRFVWAYSISEGHHVEMFDIENAFLHAHLDEEFGEVVIKLPEMWRDQKKSAYAKLLRRFMACPSPHWRGAGSITRR